MLAASGRIEAFLQAHALAAGAPAGLYARGEELWRDLAGAPPATPEWGRLLVALGELAAERLGDDRAAATWFRRCLDAEPLHRDAEACVAAGFGQGVLWERAGDPARALPAYRAAAGEGFRCAVIAPATLRAACATVRLGFQRNGRLGDPEAGLAKQSWLGWTWLQQHRPDAIDAPLRDELGRQLCAFLLPEDDPASLAGAWRGWAPHAIATPSGPWSDGDRACLRALFACAAAAADHHLADEAPAPGSPYRLLGAALDSGA